MTNVFCKQMSGCHVLTTLKPSSDRSSPLNTRVTLLGTPIDFSQTNLGRLAWNVTVKIAEQKGVKL